jgi:D-arabinose 1-dehydrogenase-like Zn-dependent alcohol dehydrogenase
MKAYQLTEWEHQPELRDVPVPEPGPGQVLVKIGGAGACHSDLHLTEWPPGTLGFDVPFTIGHENAGWVAAVGAGVEGVETGEAVQVYGPWGCGHAIKRSLHMLVPGSTAVIIGVGGLGHMGVQILRELSPARIVAVDVSDEKLRIAKEVGADETVKAGEDAAEQIREITKGRGAELVADMVGSDDSIALSAAVAKFEAHLTIVGLAGGKFEFAFGAVPFEAQLCIPYWGTAVELEECLELARQGKIKAHVEHFSLDEAPQAYAKMRSGELDGRAVINPNGVNGNGAASRN